MQLTRPAVPVRDTGRALDPYIFRDKDDPERWWCCYKHRGVLLGRAHGEENYCMLVDEAEDLLIHSPARDGSPPDIGIHGATPRGRRERAHHGEASIGIAWSDDLMRWHWPSGRG